MKLARRLAEIQPSPTLALNARAKALAVAGKDIAGLSAGEPDFDTPEHIKEAAVRALREGFTKYTATPGIPELRAAIARKLREENELDFTPEQVIVTNGGKQALYNCFQALLSEGDEVVMFAPYWVSYPEQVLLAGGRPVVVPTRVEDGFRPDPRSSRQGDHPDGPGRSSSTARAIRPGRCSRRKIFWRWPRCWRCTPTSWSSPTTSTSARSTPATASSTSPTSPRRCGAAPWW